MNSVLSRLPSIKVHRVFLLLVILLRDDVSIGDVFVNHRLRLPHDPQNTVLYWLPSIKVLSGARNRCHNFVLS